MKTVLYKNEKWNIYGKLENGLYMLIKEYEKTPYAIQYQVSYCTDKDFICE